MGDYSDAEPSLTARNHWRHRTAVIPTPAAELFHARAGNVDAI